MIFVTVGTHEQPFNRLIEKMDELVEKVKLKKKWLSSTGLVLMKLSIVKCTK